MNPNVSADEFLSAHKASITTLQALANEALDKAERLTALNLNVARSFTEDGAAHAQAMLGAGNLSEVIKLHTDKLQPRLELALGFVRGLTDIASEAQREFTQITHAWLGDVNSSFIAALDHASKSAPAGSEAVFAAVASAANVTKDLYDKMGQTAQEATEAASERMTDAADTALETAASAARQTKKTTKAIASDEES